MRRSCEASTGRGDLCVTTAYAQPRTASQSPAHATRGAQPRGNDRCGRAGRRGRWPRRRAGPSSSAERRVLGPRARTLARSSTHLPDDGEPLLRLLLRQLPARSRLRRPSPALARSIAQDYPRRHRCIRRRSCCRSTSDQQCRRPDPRLGADAPLLGSRAMDAWVKTHTMSKYEGAGGTTVMGYYDRSDLALYYALADHFTLCDGYHCSVLGPTHPNRLMQLSGTMDPDGKAGGPITDTNANPRSLELQLDDDAGAARRSRRQLEGLHPSNSGCRASTPVARSVSDLESGALQPNHQPGGMSTSDQVLPSSRPSKPARPSTRRRSCRRFPNNFVIRREHRSLPSVSWICPPPASTSTPRARRLAACSSPRWCSTR